MCLPSKSRYKAAVLWLAISGATTLRGQLTDTTPPILTGFSFTPAAIDTRPSPQNITFTATATDDLSGVTSVGGTLESPTRRQSQFVSLVRSGGTPLMATFTQVLSFPQFTESGVWRVANLTLFDAVGNRRLLETATLQAGGFPVNLSVTSTPDISPPEVFNFSMSPSPVDVSAGDQTATVSMRVTDDLVGSNPTSCGCTFQALQVVSPSGRQDRIIINARFQRISGTPQDGIWRGTFVMPRLSEPGTWQVSRLNLYDEVGNSAFFSPANLIATGGTPTLTVVSSPSDTSSPTITALNFSPGFINTSAGPQNVTITVNAADDLSGVDFLPDDSQFGPSFGYGVLIMSPSGNQTRFAGFFSPFQLNAGTPLNGTWTGTAFFPQFSEAGTYQVNLLMKDHVRNKTTLSQQDLNALGLTATVVVIQPTQTVDGNVGPAGGTVQDQVFGARASLTVPPGVLATNTSVAIDVLLSPIQVPIPQGFSIAGSYFVNIELNPRPSGLLGPPGYSVTLPLNVNRVPGTVLVLYRIDPMTNTLIPAVSVSGGFVTGVVNTSGDTVTFNGVASFSTVVALVPSGAIPGDVNGDGRVDCADVSIEKASFGKRTGQTGFDARADVNRDGVVNIADLAFVLKQLPSGMVCQ